MKSKDSNTYKCIVTGAPKYIPPSLAKKQFAKFGSADEFRKYYVSREARKLLKMGKSVSEVRTELNSPDLIVTGKLVCRAKFSKLFFG